MHSPTRKAPGHALGGCVYHTLGDAAEGKAPLWSSVSGEVFIKCVAMAAQVGTNKLCLILPLALLVLCFPVASVAVFQYGADRLFVANVVTVCYLIGIYAAAASPWISGRSRPAIDKLEVTCLIWFWIAFLTAVFWELPWLLNMDRIKAASDQAWACVPPPRHCMHERCGPR